MTRRRVSGLALMIAAQAAMGACHFAYVAYFLVMGMFSVLAMLGAVVQYPIYLVALFLLFSYPVVAAASVAVAWILFAREKKTFLPALVSCYPVLHLVLILLSYGLPG